MKATPKQIGFILLELLIAVAAFGIGITSIFGLFAKTASGPLISSEQTQSFFISQENLVAVRSLSEESLAPGIYKAGISQGSWRLFPNRGLVGHFLLAGDATDLSPYKNITIDNNLRFTADRKFQRLGAGQFNGQNSYIKTEDAFPLKRTGALTLAVWVKTIGPQRGAIAGRYDLAPSIGAYILFQDQDRYTFQISGPQGQDSISAEVTGLPWEHIAAVYDPGEPAMRLYLNGQLATSTQTNITSLNLAVDTEFFIGTDAGLSNFFNGAIADVRVYNRALTSKDIAALWRSYSAKNEKYLAIQETSETPLGLWNFNEGEGCIAHDESGNDNHGIIGPDCPTISPAWDTDRNGEQGRSLLFGGNSGVVIADSNSLLATSELSLSAWVKLPDPLPQNATTTIIQKRAAGAEDYSFALVYDAARKGYGFGISRGAPGQLESVFATSTALAGKWQHILVSFDGLTRRIYIDNQEIFTLESGFLANQGADSSLYLGQSPQGSQWFNGNLDDLRIFDKTLASSDRTALFLGKRTYFLTE